eukprot:COSAG04_NODE_1174_length_7930_cov_2.184651_2_plen_215_part_00
MVGSRPSHPGCASLDFVNNSMMSFTGAGVAAKKMAPIWPWIGRAFRCDGTDCDAVLPDSMGPNRTWEPCGPSSPALCELGTATGGWGNAQLTVFLANSSAGLQWSKTFAQPYFVIEPVSTASAELAVLWAVAVDLHFPSFPRWLHCFTPLHVCPQGAFTGQLFPSGHVNSSVVAWLDDGRSLGPKYSWSAENYGGFGIWTTVRPDRACVKCRRR